METETASQQWQGKQTVELNGVTAEQVWPLLADFCNVHKWFPSLDTCHRVDGTDGHPGLIRYCASTKGVVSSGGSDGKENTWANERLVMIDPVGRCLSYEVLENNVGFRSYVATIKVLEMDGGDGAKGCKMEWSFVVDPVDGWKLEDLNVYIGYCLQYMGKKMEDYLS